MCMRFVVTLWLLLPLAMRVLSQTALVPIQSPHRDVFEAALVPDAGPEARHPLRVVLLADEKDHGAAGNGLHDYPLWQERWALLLGGRTASVAAQVNLHGAAVSDASLEDGAPGVTVECVSGWPSDQQFWDVDVIVAYCYLVWTEARKQQVAKYLERGGGFVLIHSSTWTKPRADLGVAALMGVGGFTRYRCGEVRVEMAAPDHPICRNLPAEMVLEDETYWPPTPPLDTSRVRVLAVSYEKGGDADGERHPQPVFWIHEPGRGRIFGCVPGHRDQTFDDPWLRLWLLRGIAWAAGGCPYRFESLATRGARFNGNN